PSYGVRVTLEDRQYSAVRLVANRPGHSGLLRQAAAGGPEEHPLHLTAGDGASTDRLAHASDPRQPGSDSVDEDGLVRRLGPGRERLDQFVEQLGVADQADSVAAAFDDQVVE